jgi:hypothetical protein
LNSTFHHLPDQGFQLVFHGRTLRPEKFLRPQVPARKIYSSSWPVSCR